MIDLRFWDILGLSSLFSFWHNHLGGLFSGKRWWHCLGIWVSSLKRLTNACVDWYYLSFSSLWLNDQVHLFLSQLLVRTVLRRRVCFVTETLRHSQFEPRKLTSLVHFNLFFLLKNNSIWFRWLFQIFLVTFWNFSDLRKWTLFQ
jgi:hypothetical protein